MPIQNLHRVIISYYIKPFFGGLGTTPDELKRSVTNMFAAVQFGQRNDFYPLAKLFNEPENFFNLQLAGSLTRGEARECIIDIIDYQLKDAARKASVTTIELGWNKEALIDAARNRNDHADNLICQETDPPDEEEFHAFIKSLAEAKVDTQVEERREVRESTQEEKQVMQLSDTGQHALFSDSMSDAKIKSFIKSVNQDPDLSKGLTKVLFDHLSLGELKKIYLLKIPVESPDNEFKIDPQSLERLKERVLDRIDKIETSSELNYSNKLE